jgi:cysteine sulfinate desulfinase/cysteine desulfurase-like protein
MAYVTTEVYVELDEFDDEELLNELEGRGYYISKSTACGSPSLESLLDAWTLDKSKFEDLFREFCRENIGRSF